MSLDAWMWRLLWENLGFFLLSTAFLVVVGVAWKSLKPYTVPRPFPGWFKYWFASVQIFGVVLPVLAWLFWGVWKGYVSVSVVWLPILGMLGLQIAGEALTSRKFESVTWVMLPYLYLPYRFWQLYEGLQILPDIEALFWVRSLLWVNLVVWMGNYALDVTQLP